MQHLKETKSAHENLKTWLAAFNAKDINKLISLYDSDSIYAGASAALSKGIEEIEQRYKKAFSTVKGTLLFKEEAFFEENNMALLVGKYYFQPQVVSENAGNTGRVALVYRRSPEGRWLLLFDMDNQPPDVKPEDFD